MKSARDYDAERERDPRWKLAALYERLGRMDEYIKVSAQLVDARPGDVKARCNLGRVLMRQVRFDEAEKVLSGGPAAISAEQWELGFLRARLAVHRGDLERAVKGYREILALKPDALEIYFYLAEALMRLERTAEMFESLRRGAGVCPKPKDDDLKGWLDRFRLHLLLCDFDEAFRIGDFVLDRTRRVEHVDALRWPTVIEEYDFTCVSNDYHREALKALDPLADGGPKLPWAYYYRILFRRAVATRNLVEDADARLLEDEDTVERLAGKRYGWMLMASAQKKMYAGELPAALKLLQSVIDSTDPPNWLAQCMAGETLACMGKKADAFKAFDRAVQIAPEFEKGNILAWRGEMHLWFGEYSLAIEALDEALRRTAQYAHCWKGGALVASGRPLEALPVLERAIAISPWDLEAKAWRGEALHRLGRHREALEQLSFPAGETKSANGYWHVLRGLIRKALGDSDGLRAEVDVLSSTLFSKRPDWRQVLGPASLDSDDEIVKALEGILSRSRGLRRGSIHERMLWMP